MRISGKPGADRTNLEIQQKEMNRKRVAVTGSSFSYNSENVKWTDKTLADQKIDNLLNLAMDSTEREREKSWNLNVGYDEKMRLWDVIVFFVIGFTTCMSMSMTTGRSHRSCLYFLYDLRVIE